MLLVNDEPVIEGLGDDSKWHPPPSLDAVLPVNGVFVIEIFAESMILHPPPSLDAALPV